MLRFAISLRYIMLIASIGTALGALMMFWEGGEKILQGARIVLEKQDPRLASASVMGATDAFLFGIVLLIFTYSVAFGFVFDLPPAARQTVPAWMRVEGIQELKNTLVSVVLVYMVVDFATDWAAYETTVSFATMIPKPFSILLIAAAYRLISGRSTEVGHHVPPVAGS